MTARGPAWTTKKPTATSAETRSEPVSATRGPSLRAARAANAATGSATAATAMYTTPSCRGGSRFGRRASRAVSRTVWAETTSSSARKASTTSRPSPGRMSQYLESHARGPRTSAVSLVAWAFDAGERVSSHRTSVVQVSDERSARDAVGDRHPEVARRRVVGRTAVSRDARQRDADRSAAAPRDGERAPVGEPGLVTKAGRVAHAAPLGEVDAAKERVVLDVDVGDRREAREVAPEDPLEPALQRLGDERGVGRIREFAQFGERAHRLGSEPGKDA